MDTRNPLERYEGFGNWRELVDHLEKEIERIEDPRERSVVHIRVGRIWEDQFLEKAKAVFHYQKAFKLDQASVEALQHARRIYREMGKPRMIAQLANLELKLIEDIEGENRQWARHLFLVLGEALGDLGEVDKALQCYQQIFTLYPDDAEASACFEDLEIESGWDERASVLAEHAISVAERDPATAGVMFLRAARLLTRFEGASTRVEEFLGSACTLDPDSDVALNLLENILEGSERREQIRALHDDLLGKAPDEATRAQRALRIGSRWAVRFEDRQTAENYLEEALALDPSLESAFNMLVTNYRVVENWPRLVEVAQATIDRGPSKDAAVTMMAEAAEVLWNELDDTENASQLIGALGDIAPGHPLALRFQEWAKGHQDEVSSPTVPAPPADDIETDEPVATVELTDDMSTPPLDEVAEAEELDQGDGVANEPEIDADAEQEPSEPEQTEDAVIELQPADEAFPDITTPEVETVDVAEAAPTIEVTPPTGDEYAPTTEIEAPESMEQPHEGESQMVEPEDEVDVGEDEQVDIEEDEPHVDIEEGEPEVDIEEGEPEVDITGEEGDEPAIEVSEEDEEAEAPWDPSAEVLEAMEAAREAEAAAPTRGIEAWRKVLRIDERALPAYDALLGIFEQLKRWPDLVKTMRAKADFVSSREERIELHLNVASLFVERFSNQSEAIKSYETVLELDPVNPIALNSLKEMYERRRDWERLVGIMKTEADLVTDPIDKLDRHLEIARLAAQRLKKPVICIELWERVRESDQDNEEALTALAVFYERSKDFEKLAEVLSRQVSMMDDDTAKVAVLVKLGTICGDKLGDNAKAVEAWKALLELNPDDRRAQEQLKKRYLAMEAWEDLEQFYAQSGKWDEFIRVLEREADKDGMADETRISLQFKLAELWAVKKQRVDRSARSYEKILEIDPQNLRAAEALIPIFQDANEHAKLARVCEVKLGHEEDQYGRLELQRTIASLNEEQTSDNGAAFEWFHAALETEPSEELGREDLERLAAATGRWEEVVELYKKVLEEVDEPERLKLRLARVLDEELGQPEEALEWYATVLDADPTSEDAIGGLVRLYGQLGQYQKLLEVFDRKFDLTDDPDERKDIYYERAALLEDQIQDISGAVETYNNILEMAGEEERALRALDRLYEGQEDWPALADVIERQLAVGLEEEATIALKFRLGEVRQRWLEDLAGSIDCYREILVLQPEHEGARAALEELLGQDHELKAEIATILDPIYQSQEEWEKLIGVLEILIPFTEDPQGKVSLLMRIGQIHQQELQSFESAFDAYGRAVRADPSSDDARVQLEDLATVLDWWPQLAELFEWAAQQVEDQELARDLWLIVARVRWEQMENAEEAVRAYQQVLEIEPQETTAISALESIFTHTERWSDLIDVLRRKAEMTYEPDAKEALYTQMAGIYDEMLDEPEEAAGCYREILTIDSTNLDALRALDRLYERQEQWSDLADNLEQQLSLALDDQAAAVLQLRLADLRETKMEEVASAIEIHRDVLERDLNNMEALDALERLIQLEEHRLTIALILEPIYQTVGEWQKLIGVTEILIANEEDPRRKVELRHRIAELYETMGDDPDNSFESYAAALGEDSADPMTQENLERLARNLGLFERLAEVYDNQAVAIEEDPDLASSLHAKVATICEEQLGDADRAIKHWSRVLELDAGHIEAADALVRIYQVTERYEDLAKILITKVEMLEDVDDRKQHLFRAGEIYETVLEQLDEAVGVYQGVLDIDLDDLEALSKLEALFLRTERWSDLQTVYQRKTDLVETVEEKKELLYVMGAVYEREVQDVEQAIDTYQRVLELDPDDLQAMQRLDELYQSSEQWHELLTILEREAELVINPDEVIGFKFRIGALWEQHLEDVGRSVEVYREILQVFPDHPETIMALEGIVRGDREPLLAAEILESLYEDAGEWRKLIEVLEVQLAYSDVDDPWSRVQLLHRIAGLFESELHLDSATEAFDAFARAFVEDAGNEETLAALDRLAELTGRWEELAQLFDRFLDDADDPDRIIDVGLRVARIFEERLGNSESAIERHTKVLEPDPENKVALEALDRLYQITEQWEALSDILRRESTIAASPEDALEFQFRLGQVYETELQNLEEAIECYRDILAAAPEHVSTLHALEMLFTDGTRQVEIAEILDPLYRMAGLWDKLVGINEALLEGVEDPYDRVAVMHKIAEIYEEKLVDEINAFTWYGHAVRQMPTDERSLEELERLATTTSGWGDAIAVYGDVFEHSEETEIKKHAALRMARAYEEEIGDAENAEQTFRRVLDLDGYDVQALEALDRIYLNYVEWEKLAEILSRRIEVAETDDFRVEYCFRLGKVHEEQRDDDDSAVSCFRRIIEDFDQHNAPSLDSLEDIFFRHDRWSELYETFERKLDIAPSETAKADLYAKMAITAAEAMDQVEQGVELWGHVLDIRGEDPEALQALGELYGRQENWNELVDILDRQAQIADDDDTRIRIYQELGEVWGARLEDDQNALENWERVLDIAPGNLTALRALAGIHEKNEGWHDLVDTLHRMIDAGALDMEDDEIKRCYSRLGELYADTLQQPYDAIESWIKVTEIDPNDMQAIEALEKLYSEEARWEDLVNILGKKAELIEEAESKIDVLMQVASTWEEQILEPLKALSAYERILEADPLHDHAFMMVEKIYDEEMRWEDLTNLYLTRLGHVTEREIRIDLYHRMARVYEKNLNSAENAFLILQKAFEEDYTHDETADEIERLAGVANKWNELLNSCNQVLQTVQDREIQISLSVKIGRWYAELDHPDYAVAYFNQVLTLDPEHTGALGAMAGIYRGQGQWDALAQVLTRQTEVSKDDDEKKETFFSLGELYEEKLNRTDQALSSYKQALDIDDTMPESLTAVERLYRNSQSWTELIPILRKRIEIQDDPEEIVEIQRQVGEIYEHRLDDANSAIEAYREILEHDASYMPALKGLEGLFTREERWQDLLDVLEMQLEVVTTERERIELLLRMASMLENEFVKPERAAEKLEIVLDTDPVNESALTGLERLYRQGQRWQELVDTYFRHIDATPDRQARIGLYHEVAKVYAAELDDAHSAVEALRNVLGIDPDDALALEGLADLFEKIEDWVGAHDSLSRLVQIVPDPEKRVELYYRIGVLLSEQMHDQAGAVDQYRNALDIEPGHLESLNALRLIYTDREDWMAAARILEQEQEFTPQDRQRSELLFLLGQISADHLDDQPRAVECYELALECDAENVEAAKPLVEVYARDERWEDAERLLDMLIRKAQTFKPEPAQMQRFQFLLGEASTKQEKDDKALKAYRSAYDIDATHLPTLRGIASLYFKKQDWDKAFKFYQMILVHHREAQNPEQIVDIFYRLGVIKLEVGERRKALNMFDKAMEINTNHRLTLEAVVTLHEKHGDWEKVIHFKKQMLLTATPEEAFDLQVQIGDTWQEKLQNGQKAIQSYNEGLELQPENHVLLHKLLNLYTATEQWQQAVEVIERIASLEPNEQRIAKYHYSIALVFRDKIKDADQAINHFNQSLDTDTEQLKAFEAIDRILTQRKDWQALEKNYRKMLHRISGKGKTDIEVNLWHFLGEIYRSRMGKFEASAEAFKMASRLDQTNLERHKILAELYMSIPDKWEDAVEEHQFLIRENPYQVDSYKALRKIYFDSRQYDKAWCLCATLSFLKKADPEEQQFYEQYKTKGMIRAQSRLDNERWIKELFHHDEDLYIGKIFETILPSVRRFKVQQHKAFGLRKKDRHDTMTSTITFAKTFAYVAQVLNLPFLPELYLRPDQAMGLQYATTDPPASVVGQLLLSGFTPQDLTFEIGRHLAYYRGEHYIRWVEPTTAGLRLLLLAGIKAVNPQFQTPPDPSGVLDQTVGTLTRTLTPTAQEQLSALVRKFIQSTGEADVKTWTNAVEMTACRAGFLLCNDIQSAARMIQNQAASVGDIPAKEKIKELVLFSVSEQYFRLRGALGVTIGQ